MNPFRAIALHAMSAFASDRSFDCNTTEEPLPTLKGDNVERVAVVLKHVGLLDNEVYR